jgi:16S rRNA (guanine966-N2)-methyltransferase
MDPPYDNLLEKDVLERLQFSTLVSEDTLIIVEASLDTEFDYVSDYGFEIIKEKIYKTNKHVFIGKK